MSNAPIQHARRLIVNADDFGLSPGVNQGILAAHDHGVVTSASVMVRWPAAEAAVAAARSHPRLSLGLHIDLGEWFFEGGDWHPLYQVVPTDDPDALTAEVDRQLARFRELVGRDPTHIDSHQHVHRVEPVATVALQVAEEIGVPLRTYDARIGYCGDFYGRTREGRPLHQAITVQALIDLVRALPEGVTELACHPGEGSQSDGEYGMERQLEVRALTDFRVRATLEREGIRLCSFADFA